MRLFAIHDADGRIASLALSPAYGPASRPAARRGQILTEVDASGLDLEPADTAMPQRLLEVVQHYRVERAVQAGSKARLIPHKSA